jgi:hypothetical protein
MPLFFCDAIISKIMLACILGSGLPVFLVFLVTYCSIFSDASVATANYSSDMGTPRDTHFSSDMGMLNTLVIWGRHDTHFSSDMGMLISLVISGYSFL